MRIFCLSYQHNLDVPGHEFRYTDINEIEQLGWEESIRRIVAFKPDILFEREFNDGKALYMPLFQRVKEQLPQITRAKYFIDTHVALQLHKMYAKEIDVGFFAIGKYAHEFKKLLGSDNAFWLPLCYPDVPPSIVPNYGPIRHPLLFVGRWNAEWFPKRTRLIDVLKARYGDRFSAVTDYQNYRTLLKQSKVAFNCAINGDLNFRVFEVLAAGTELVTDPVDDLYKIKGLKERLHVYGDEEELVAMIDRLLADDPTITTNVLQTQRWVKESHTITNRMTELLEMVHTRKQHGY